MSAEVPRYPSSQRFDRIFAVVIRRWRGAGV